MTNRVTFKDGSYFISPGTMDPTGQSQNIDHWEPSTPEPASDPEGEDFVDERMVGNIIENARHAEKRPRILECEEHMPEETMDETPDLHLYFSEYEMANADIIRICRSYANYLASQRRQRGPGKKLF